MKRTSYPLGLPYELFGQWDWYRSAPAAIRHKGLAFYDRERMKRALLPIVHGRDFTGYAAPPSFVQLPASWGEWETVPAGYFHNGPIAPAQIAVESAERTTVEYTLRNVGGEYPWSVCFADSAEFTFRSLAIAESAIVELLKIRKAAHPKPSTRSKRAPSCVFFNAKRQRDLPVDAALAA